MERIADKVAAALVADGWEAFAGGRFEKVIVGWAEGGGMVPDGRRRVRLVLDGLGRWFERVDGWGKVEKDVDLREFDNAAAAIAAILDKGN